MKIPPVPPVPPNPQTPPTPPSDDATPPGGVQPPPGLTPAQQQDWYTAMEYSNQLQYDIANLEKGGTAQDYINNANNALAVIQQLEKYANMQPPILTKDQIQDIQACKGSLESFKNDINTNNYAQAQTDANNALSAATSLTQGFTVPLPPPD